jgi:Ni,Fe-hydrogenase I cytochrome b subunit
MNVQPLALASSMFFFGLVVAMIGTGISLIYRGRILDLEQFKDKREFIKKKKELTKEIKYTGYVLVGIAGVSLILGIYLMQKYLYILIQVVSDNIS